jgi:hypothetical protein
MRTGIEGLAEDLRAQREFLAARAPAYAALLDELGRQLDGPLAETLRRAWAGRTFTAFYHRPLLLLASLRYDALCEGSAHPLWRAVASEPADPGAVTTRAVLEAAERERFFDALRLRDVQTNETSRAVAWLLPAHLLARSEPKRDVALVDLGASAGLNLIADELPFPWTDDTGSQLALTPLPRIASRLGFDIAPVDVRDEDAAQWLRACVWPGDPARSQRFEQALRTYRIRAAEPAGPQVDRCALQDVAPRLRAFSDVTCVLAVQTIVRSYLSREDRAAYARSMQAWIEERPSASAVWVELEVDECEVEPDRSAVLTAKLAQRRGEPVELRLARTHPHPLRLWLDPQGTEAFESAIKRCRPGSRRGS